jgi:hypothetical protein
MNRKFWVLSILTVFVLLGLAVVAQGPATRSSTRPVVATPPNAGLVLHIDPVTGAVVDNPASGTGKLAVPATLSERWSTSGEGLVERPNPSGGKGYYVNLQGRFENGMVATVDANGRLHAPCAQGLGDAAYAASRK